MSQETNTVAWWRLLNRYQWFVLIVAAAVAVAIAGCRHRSPFTFVWLVKL